MAEYVVAQAAVLIVPTLGKGNQFGKQVEALLKKERHKLDIELRADSDKFIREGLAAKKFLEKDPVDLRFRVVDATKQITEIRHKYEDLVRETKKALVLDLKIVGMTLLPQLAQGLAAVNASMVQLVQTAALLPGVLAGAASSIGAVVSGLSGVKEAFKEYSDAQKNSAQEGLKARNAAKNVQNAYRDLGRSFKDAKRNLEDLNAELRGAPLDEAEAIIAVAEARAEAADRAGKSGLQMQKDAIALARAENSLIEVRMRNSRLIQDVAEANAKGVAGADAVVEATERLSKAQDEASTQATKLSDSLKKVSPNAQAFFQAVTGMSEQWEAFKNATQESLFAGLDAEITQLARVGLPTLQKGFVAINEAINSNVKSAFRSIGSQGNQGLLDRIFGNTATAQANLSKFFDPFIDSILRLSAAGSDFLPRLVDGLVDLTERFDNFIVRADSDGSLDKWINQGIDEFKALGHSIMNITSMLNSLSEAFTGSGGKTFLQTLQDGTESLAEFMKSADGQERLKAFFNEAREELEQWKPLLNQLPDLISNVSQAAQQFADIVMPILRTTATVLADHPGLVNAIFFAFVAWKGLFPILKGFKSGIDGLNAGIGLFRAGTDETGKKMERGIIKKVKDLTGSFLSAGGLIATVSTAATVIAVDLAAAHAEAEEAARRQREEVDKLVTSLDEVTGAATGATRAQVGKNLINAVNEKTGQKFPDLGKMLTNPTAYVDAVTSGNLDAALGMIPNKATADDVLKFDNGRFWTDNQESLQKAGLTPQIIADAVNGEPTAVKKYTDWQYGEMDRKAPPGVSDPATLDWLENRNLISKTVDLNDIQNSLSPEKKSGAALSGETYAYNNSIVGGGRDIRTQNEYSFGKFRLRGGSALAQFGPIGDPSTADGKTFGMITTSAPQENTPLEDQLSSEGVTFEDDGNGRFIVRMSAEAANKYLERYAAGGLISGPGSGTSDSILAALSNGEYVVNAAATQKYLPLLESINGGGVPGFAPGGPIIVPQSPAPTPSPSLIGGAANAGATYVAPAVPAPIYPKDSSLLNVDLSSSNLIGGAGSASPSEVESAARMPAVYTAPRPKGTLEKIGGAVGAVGRSVSAGLGLYNIFGDGTPPSGYSETSTATMNTSDSAYSALREPYKRPKGAPVPGDPNVPKNVRDFLGQVLGSPLANSGPARPVPLLPSSGSTSGGTVKSSTDSRVNPTTTVHSGTKPSAGPGNAIPHTVPGSPGRPGPYPGSVAGGSVKSPVSLPAEAGFVPASLPVVSMGAINPEMLADYVGLPAGSAINYGQAGFPDWVYQIGAPFGMVASTYSGHQEGGGTNKGIDWAPNGVSWNTPEGAQMMTNYAKYLASTGMMEQVIYQNPFTGETVGIANGKPVGPGTDQPQYYAADWAGHQDHIHTRTSKAIPTPAQLQQLGLLSSSPSNMALAGTPTGVQLPQFTYGPNGGGSASGASGASGGLRLPTPEEYAKYVSDAWMSTINDLVKNAGQIAIGFLGSFFGLDLSKITGLANSVIGGIDLPGADEGKKGGDSGGDVASQLGALPDVDAILQAAGQLPPEYQQAFVDAAMANPSQAGSILQQLQQSIGSSGVGSVQYDPSKGAEQWRPVVKSILQKVAPEYGITNLQAWEDALVKQIQTESGGNPNVDNLNDSNGKGVTQQVFGLGQFLPSTFAAHNRTGGDIRDPIAQIYAMIDYVATKYGMDASGAPNQIGRGVGYASGGRIKGPGGGRSDSIIARVSNGEYIVRAPMAQKHMGLLEAINSNKLPGFADGGLIPLQPIPPTPAPPPPPPVTTPPPPPSPVPPAPAGPQADAAAGMPSAPTPVTEAQGPGDAESTALKDVGAALGGIGSAISGVADGATAPAGDNPEGDPRATLGAAPQNLDHNKPAVSQGIQAAAGAIAGAVSTAMQAASVGANAAAPGSGQGLSSAAGIVNGLISAGGSAVVGAVNVLSSLGVGTVTPSTSTAGAYGAPLTPEGMGQQPYQGPSVVNNWNGGVHTSNNEEFYKLQQRRELQNAAPYLPQR